VPLALILSSYVAAARIGGGAQQYALAAFGIDPVLAPTVLFGRSPAKGARGQATDPALFERLLADIEADGLFGRADLLITGHFSLPEQVLLAAETIRRVRAAAPAAAIVVDPILGDEPKGLYVRADVAEAVARDLVPLADWITPNLWELRRLSGLEAGDAPGAVEAARRLGRRALVTSVPVGDDEIGLLCCEPLGATLFTHRRLVQVPNGAGDLVAAVFGAGLVEGLEPHRAAERAARAAAEAVEAAEAWGTPELPIVALGQRLVRPSAELRIERLA
jgi:pyridoxine kinase